MREYFKLQFTLTNRKIRDFGMNPVLGYVLLAAAFVFLVAMAFMKFPTKAQYIIAALGILPLTNLSEKQRSDFLYIVYGDKTKRKIRIIENLIICLPFVIALVVKNQYLVAAAMPIVSTIMAFVEFHSKNFVLPTPFSKHPFEFSVGFRYTFFMFPLLYGLAIIALSVNNLNLGLASIIMLSLMMSGYYYNPENEYYVWIFADNSKNFLRKKAANALKNTLLTTLPVVALLIVGFTPDYWKILLTMVWGILIVITTMLTKYSKYPDEIGFIEVILALSVIILPPMALIVMPIAYIRSTHRLKKYLND